MSPGGRPAMEPETRICPQCGNPYPVTKSWEKSKKVCGRKCSGRIREKAERNLHVCLLATEGKSLDQIALIAGVSKTRIQQILARGRN